MDDRALLQAALSAREAAYAPYSGYQVGAALVTEQGNLYTGVNVENASFGATVCAERTAVFKAVSAGERKITAIAIAAAGDAIPQPCGICLQVLAEFASGGLRIICGNSGGEFTVYTLEELLPHAFRFHPRIP